VIRLLEHVQPTTIEPLIRARVVEGARLYTDEYDLSARLGAWGYDHHRVGHSRGEYARDEDGDGFHEVHVNTMAGVWSLLRSWRRPHRGISREHLPLYLSFFQFVHNARVRGKGLLQSLPAALVGELSGIQQERSQFKSGLTQKIADSLNLCVVVHVTSIGYAHFA